MDHTRTERTERSALATLAAQPTITLPTMDDGARALVSHIGALIASRNPRTQQTDRDDLIQVAALQALALIHGGTDPVRAARMAAGLITHQANSDRAETPTTAYDPTDHETTEALDRIAAYRPAQPDQVTHTTDADLLADTLASIGTEEPPALEAIERTTTRTGRLPKALTALLADHGEATIRRYLHQRQQPNGGRLTTHDGRTAIKARQEAKHAAWQARKQPRKEGPARPQIPTSGPASALVVSLPMDANGYPAALAYGPEATNTYALAWTETETIEHPADDDHEQAWTERRTIHHREPITAETAALILARTPGTAYKANATDRAADALAYAMTPLGPVAKPNTRKQKRSGGIGGPVITRGPRLDWATKTSR